LEERREQDMRFREIAQQRSEISARENYQRTKDQLKETQRRHQAKLESEKKTDTILRQAREFDEIKDKIREIRRDKIRTVRMKTWHARMYVMHHSLTQRLFL
jgi:hypothetical protein